MTALIFKKFPFKSNKQLELGVILGHVWLMTLKTTPIAFNRAMWQCS